MLRPIDVNAAPAQLLKDGALRIVAGNGLLKRPLMQQVNRELFRRNKFERKVNAAKESRSADIAIKRHYYEIPDDAYNCAADHVVLRSLAKEAEHAGICSGWSRKCGAQGIIPITGDAFLGAAYGATHILLSISRHVGALNANSSMEAPIIADKLMQRLNSYLPSLLSASQLSKNEAFSISESLRANRNYVPSPGEAQSVLAFLISALTWFAEWIVSNPVRALQVGGCIILRLHDWFRASNDRAGAYRRAIVSKLYKRRLLIIPAIVGLIPIAVGCSFARGLEDAESGALAMGFAISTHDGRYDPNPADDLFKKGASVHLTLLCQKGTASENLETEYLIALWIASILLLFSCVPIIYAAGIALMKGYNYRRAVEATERTRVNDRNVAIEGEEPLSL